MRRLIGGSGARRDELPGSGEHDRRGVLQSARIGARVGVDRVLGGTNVDGRRASPARPCGTCRSPAGRSVTRRAGRLRRRSGEHCARRAGAGCGGVDLLAYRATEADPLELVRARAARARGGTLLVAGSVNRAQQVRALAAAGADAFTVGSAVFDGSFSPHGLVALADLDMLEACERQMARRAIAR